MTSQQRLVLVIAILASFVAFLDGSVINVALPAIMRDMGGGLTLQQWVVDAYLITLGSLILLAGSLSDLFGRQRILAIGLAGFGAASILCAVAPTGNLLIIFRALQGIAGALLVPSSLALIISTFSGAAQGKAIGTWTAWTGMAFIFGPLLGGFFVDSTSWRLIFGINILPIAVTLWLMRKVAKSDIQKDRVPLDVVGATLCGLGLAAAVFSLIEQARFGWHDWMIRSALSAGIIMLITFLVYESRAEHPMLPLGLFKVRNFTFGNLATTSIYAGLSVATFLLAVFVQQVGGYSAIQAGLALMPVTLLMFFLSPRFGALSGKFGPRWFMTFGPLLGSLGFFLMLNVDKHVSYWPQLLPGIVLFGIGLSATVSPLTSAVLGSIDSKQAGIGSAVNNAIARIAGLVAIAFIGIVTGSHLDVDGFRRGVILTAILLAVGGLISAIGIQNSVKPAETNA
jgi:EmrB/QacA subfamily drug resistance transporter